MKFRISQLDVEYKGVLIPINSIKRKILERKIDLSSYELTSARRYDRRTLETRKKYAWDAIISDMVDDNSLEKIIKEIINEEI